MDTFEITCAQARVTASFNRQALMHTLGARLVRIASGEVDIEMDFRAEFTQQHGYTHAGVVAALVDTACGYAALTLMPDDSEVLTVEFKINLVAPARGDRLLATARVKRSGRTLTVCSGDVHAFEDDHWRLVATMMATLMAVPAER